jgi:putative tricarboxylic transport membrane protein
MTDDTSPAARRETPMLCNKAQVKSLACALLLFTSPLSATAQDAPRDLTIVAPAAPGGGWDQTARVMQQVLRATNLARSVQVVNAPGAAGTIGLARFVSAEAGNGSALLVTGLVMVSGIATNRSPVTLADVTPIARLSGEYEVIVVPAASPFRSLADLVAAFRSDPRAISWGGGSAGGTDEILVRLLADRIGVDPAAVNYIAYSGGGQALASVLGAHVTAAVSGLGEFAAQIESGGLRALAISSPERVPGVGVPTFREQGVQLELLNWRGVVASPGLSRAERRGLEELVGRMAATAMWKAALRRNGWADIYMEADEFRRFLLDETARVAPLVARASSGRRGSRGFELFVLLGGTIAVAAAAGRVWAERRKAKHAPPAEGSTSPTNVAALGTLALALLLDVVLIEWLGFVVASTLMFGIAARAFGSRGPARDVIIGLALAVVIHVAFTRGLGVSLPNGVFG